MIANAQLQMTGHSYGDYAVYMCMAGYEMTSKLGQKMHSILCDASGRWEPPPLACQRKELHSFFFRKNQVKSIAYKVKVKSIYTFVNSLQGRKLHLFLAVDISKDKAPNNRITHTKFVANLEIYI